MCSSGFCADILAPPLLELSDQYMWVLASVIFLTLVTAPNHLKAKDLVAHCKACGASRVRTTPPHPYCTACC